MSVERSIRDYLRNSAVVWYDAAQPAPTDLPEYKTDTAYRLWQPYFASGQVPADGAPLPNHVYRVSRLHDSDPTKDKGGIPGSPGARIEIADDGDERDSVFYFKRDPDCQIDQVVVRNIEVIPVVDYAAESEEEVDAWESTVVVLINSQEGTRARAIARAVHQLLFNPFLAPDEGGCDIFSYRSYTNAATPTAQFPRGEGYQERFALVVSSRKHPYENAP